MLFRIIQEKVLPDSEVYDKQRTLKSPLLLVFMRKMDLKNTQNGFFLFMPVIWVVMR